MSSCALTGHRELRRDFSEDLLEKQLEDLIENGTDTFYCGMAVGFDLVCAKILLRCKERYPLKLIACIPHPNQSERFSAYWKKEYEECVAKADERVIVSKEYSDGCMQKRNRYMVDHADFVFAYLFSETGGTAATVRYAKQKGKPIRYYGQPYMPFYN